VIFTFALLINPAILPFRHIQAALGLGKHKHYLSLHCCCCNAFKRNQPFIVMIKLRQLLFISMSLITLLGKGELFIVNISSPDRSPIP
jgi:hypothetical protein